MKPFRDLLRRGLPVGAAALALLSLALIPSFLPRTSGEDFESLRKRHADDPAAAEAGLRDFLRRHPGHGDASLLLAESLFASDRLDEAWALASGASLKRRIADRLLERNLVRESVARRRVIHRETGDPGQALLLAAGLADLGESREAVALLEEYFRSAPPGDRPATVLAQARILWRLGRHEEMLPILSAALEQSPAPDLLGRLQLERGKALARLRRPAEAHAALDEAEELLVREEADMARLFKAELYLRAGNPRGEEMLDRLIRDRSALAPVARLLRGGLEDLLAGLSALRDPGPLHAAGFDVAALQAGLREADGPRPATAAAAAGELVRLFPGATALVDHARLLRRAGRFEEAAARFLEADAVREAAGACLDGGLHLRAASLFRRAGDLFLEAESLRRAGHTRDALPLFARFAASARLDDPRLAIAFLHRGRMLAEMGRREEALAEFDRVLRAEEVVTDPLKTEWLEALLERGRNDPKGAREALAELLERTAGDPARPELAARAAIELARAEVREKAWPEALGHLRDAERLAAGLADPSIAREARLLVGEVLHVRGDYEEAVRVFSDACREGAAEDRRRALLGRSRALARLGRKEEARRDLQQAGGDELR